MASASAFRGEPREFLEGVVRAAIAAAEPSAAVAARGPREIRGRAVRVVGAGKAVAGMVRGLVNGCGCRVVGGVIVGPTGTPGSVGSVGMGAGVEVHEADHPLATERNVRAAARVLEFVESPGASAGVPLVVLISGGASAHLTLPAPGLTLGDVRAATDALLRAGASIDELNCVRKHCEVLKGGGLARAAARTDAVVWTLILSDVVGDRLDVIGSGPTAPDPTTHAEAIGVMRARGVDERPEVDAVVRHLQRGTRAEVPETVKSGDPCLARVRHTIVGSNSLAVEAAGASAAAAGCAVAAKRTGMTGEAADVARALAAEVLRLRDAPGTGARCVIWGGETTVTVRGKGKGGRNQELALSAAIALDGVEGVAVGSFATDGVDGPTDAAGAVITGRTCGEARRARLEPARALAENDSYAFFRRVGGLLTTGATGTNVNDIMVGLAW